MGQNELSENLNKWDYINGYSNWMYHIYEPYVGKRVFDVGAGMGRMVKYYIDNAERVVATDIFKSQVDFMNRYFSKCEIFRAELIDILNDDLAKYYEEFDTVICINVLEHLEDDVRAVKNMKKLLTDKGKLILFVPAFQKLYCSMDKNVNHYRRYNKGVLREIAKECEMEIVANSYFNLLGIIPYWLKGRFKKEAGESFSTSLNENNSKVYNFASKILEPIEKRFPPKFGLSEMIVLSKKG